MRQNIFLIFFLCISVSYSQKVSHYDNGNTKDSLIKYKDGLTEYFRFYKSYKLLFHFKDFYSDNMEVLKEVKEYYITGELQYERITDESFENIGTFISYFENGKIEQKGSFNKKHIPSGDWYSYYDDGTLLTHIVNDKAGKLTLQKEFLPDGSLHTKKTRIASKNLYKVLYYYNNGNVNSMGYQDLEGNNVGEYTDYYEDGNVSETGAYNDNGKKTGTWKLYRKNGLLYWDKNYEDNGNYQHRIYGENGKLREEGMCTYYGNEIGVWTYYDDGGEVEDVKDYGE